MSVFSLLVLHKILYEEYFICTVTKYFKILKYLINSTENNVFYKNISEHVFFYKCIQFFIFDVLDCIFVCKTE